MSSKYLTEVWNIPHVCRNLLLATRPVGTHTVPSVVLRKILFQFSFLFSLCAPEYHVHQLTKFYRIILINISLLRPQNVIPCISSPSVSTSRIGRFPSAKATVIYCQPRCESCWYYVWLRYGLIRTLCSRRHVGSSTCDVVSKSY